MRSVVVAQLRRGGGRLVAAGIAIALGSAFVAAALLGSHIMKQTAYNSVSARYAMADLVLDASFDEDLGPALEEVAALPGVAAVSPVRYLSFVAGDGARTDWVWAQTTAGDPRLEQSALLAGALPEGREELALAQAVVERIGLELGDEVVVTDFSDSPIVTARLVGVLEDAGGFDFDAPSAVVDGPLALAVAERTETELTSSTALVLLEDGADLEQVRAAAQELPSLAEARVLTVEERAHETVTHFAGETDVLTGIVLTFAGVALVVAAIVIANTFQVLVAQRARTLALLRCVGATRRQVRGSVVLEALVVGLLGSAAGVLLGILLAQSALWIVPSLNLAVPVPSVVSVSPASVLWPLATGTLVTVLAALAPARVATRVAPLAALRPLELTPVRRGSTVRLVLALTGVLLGGAVLAAATVLSQDQEVSDPTLFVLAGIAGGAVSVTGLLIGAVYFVPGAARVLGSLAARLAGVPGRVAAANSVRNPRRTTATASALLIGAGLVTMMATGAATARHSLESLLAETYPVDVAVVGSWTEDTGIETLTPGQVSLVESADGVAAAAEIRGTRVLVRDEDGHEVETVAYSARPEDVARVARSRSTEVPPPGTVYVPVWVSVAEGSEVTVRTEAGTLTGTAVRSPLGDLWLSQEDAARLGGGQVTSGVWVALEEDTDPAAFATGLRDAFTERSEAVGDTPPSIAGAAVERQAYEQVIDTLLAIVVGLLGVAVVIAVVGVANTLSLSVIERRRESATLRAIGLRKGQLRQMLAIEGVIIAVVGAVLGAVLGLVYGWCGSAILLGPSGGLALAMPWRDLGIILLVAVLAGLLASVVPSRTATRTSPVAALAVD